MNLWIISFGLNILRLPAEYPPYQNFGAGLKVADDRTLLSSQKEQSVIARNAAEKSTEFKKRPICMLENLMLSE